MQKKLLAPLLSMEKTDLIVWMDSGEEKNDLNFLCHLEQDHVQDLGLDKSFFLRRVINWHGEAQRTRGTWVRLGATEMAGQGRVSTMFALPSPAGPVQRSLSFSMPG